MKRIAILQSNYIPWKGYFDLIARADEFIIYDCVQYTKNDWRNRNQIKTAQGKAWLTVPVRQRHLGQTIDETEIADPRCFRKHWNTFRQAYAKAPHMAYCVDLLEDIFLGEAPPTLLSHANLRLIERICEGLSIDTHLSNATRYSPSGDRNDRLLDICIKAGASSYLSGPAARAYLDESRFRAAGIKVEWMRYGYYPEYHQLHPPFDHHVSVLDLLAATGPDAMNYLQHSRAGAPSQ